MTDIQKLLSKFSVDELDRELIARGEKLAHQELVEGGDEELNPELKEIIDQVEELYQTLPPRNKALECIDTGVLIRELLRITLEIRRKKAIRGDDDRVDFYRIDDERIMKNAGATAAICLENGFTAQTRETKGLPALRVKKFGKLMKMCEIEPFYHQPVITRKMCTGFLVKEDVIATAGHFANEINVKDLRIVFGYKMLGPETPVTRIPQENIYKGVDIIGRAYNFKTNGPDWALVRLDRAVVGHTPAVLSGNEISRDQSVYILGYPVGLPLKYAAGASIDEIDDIFFRADLDVYSGNSGSPVFDDDTHEIVGMVVHGESRDFRNTDRGLVTVRYPDSEIASKKSQCTRVSQFIDIVENL